ncbi:hypothetical protein LG326_16005 [Metaplanococcus flavidus]
MKKTGFILVIALLAGVFLFIQNEQKKTTFGEIVSAGVDEDVEIYRIAINRFPDNSGSPVAYSELTEPEDIQEFLTGVSKTKLKAGGDLMGSETQSYSIHFFHYTEDLTVHTDSNIAGIYNTRMDALKDENPVDLAPSYTIDGQDFFFETIGWADLEWDLEE